VGAVISVDLAKLPAALDRGERRVRRAVAAGALAGAHSGRAAIVKRTPVDLGQLKASWKVTAGAKEFTGPETQLAELANDAPTVGIVELGARPHKVSPEAWAAIYQWVRRHFRGGKLGGKGRMRPQPRDQAGRFSGGGDGIVGPFKGADPLISKITNAIAWKLRTKGQRPTFFVRNSLDELRNLMAIELERAIAAAVAAGEGEP